MRQRRCCRTASHWTTLSEGISFYRVWAAETGRSLFTWRPPCLRRLGQIEALIDACLARPLPRRPVPVRSLLRLGAAQLVFLRTAHAVVHTAVELARRPPAGSHAALIDAVLRRLAREGARWAETQDAARLNTPDWLWHSWAASYSGAVAGSIAQIHLAEPPLT